MNIFGIGLPEMAVIAAIGLLVFGPKRLPELGKTLGKTLKGFQSASSQFEQEFRKAVDTVSADTVSADTVSVDSVSAETSSTATGPADPVSSATVSSATASRDADSSEAISVSAMPAAAQAVAAQATDSVPAEPPSAP